MNLHQENINKMMRPKLSWIKDLTAMELFAILIALGLCGFMFGFNIGLHHKTNSIINIARQ